MLYFIELKNIGRYLDLLVTPQFVSSDNTINISIVYIKGIYIKTRRKRSRKM